MQLLRGVVEEYVETTELLDGFFYTLDTVGFDLDVVGKEEDFLSVFSLM